MCSVLCALSSCCTHLDSSSTSRRSSTILRSVCVCACKDERVCGWENVCVCVWECELCERCVGEWIGEWMCVCERKSASCVRDCKLQVCGWMNRWVNVCVCPCVCERVRVCVCVRARKRARESEYCAHSREREERHKESRGMNWKEVERKKEKVMRMMYK